MTEMLEHLGKHMLEVHWKWNEWNDGVFINSVKNEGLNKTGCTYDSKGSSEALACITII